MVLKRLGIYGWKEQDENLALASLLTGDPLLLIGNHGYASMSDDLKRRLKKHGLVRLTGFREILRRKTRRNSL